MRSAGFFPTQASMHKAKRRLALVGQLAQTWTDRPQTPTRVVLDVTRRCNLRCSMCRTWQRDTHRELSAADYSRLFSQLPGLTWLDITGGEPFLRNDIAAIFSSAADRCKALRVLHFQTNGWMTRRVTEVTESLRKRSTRFDLIVTVSIDGPGEIHDRIRGRAGSYRRAIATAQALMQLEGIDVHIGTTVQQSNELHLKQLRDRLFDDLKGFSDDHWHVNAATRSEHFFANGQVENLETRGNDFLDDQIARRGVPRSMVALMELLYLLHLKRYRTTGTRLVPCEALRSTAFISPEGDLFPCHIYDRPLGNVARTSVTEVWNSTRTASARQDVEQLKCGGCFSACEAYPALAAAPLSAVWGAGKQAIAQWRESR